MERWRTLARSTLVDKPYFKLHADVCAVGGEEIGTHYVVDGPSWVTCLAFTQDRHVLLVEQYRHGVDDFTWELPAGLIDAGETPESAAARELLEETGFRGRCLGVLHQGAPATNRMAMRASLVGFEGAVEVAPIQRTALESTQLRLWPADRVRDLAFEPRFADLPQTGLLLAGLLRLGLL